MDLNIKKSLVKTPLVDWEESTQSNIQAFVIRKIDVQTSTPYTHSI